MSKLRLGARFGTTRQQQEAQEASAPAPRKSADALFKGIYTRKDRANLSSAHRAERRRYLHEAGRLNREAIDDAKELRLGEERLAHVEAKRRRQQKHLAAN